MSEKNSNRTASDLQGLGEAEPKENLIVDNSETPRYFVMVPMLIDDMELSVYAVRLYLRILRRVGNGENGNCWENTRNLAKGCNMSAASVSRAKKELESKGLITLTLKTKTHGEFPYHEIAVNNIWKLNSEKYSTCSPQKQVLSHHRNRSCFCGDTEVNAFSRMGMEGKKGVPLHAPLAASGKEPDAVRDKRTPKHPTIEAVKQVMGCYPRKNLYQRIIEKVGENPDIPRMQNAFDTWVANGYNPQNVKGWLLDWYCEDMHYVPLSQRLDKGTAEDASPPAAPAPITGTPQTSDTSWIPEDIKDLCTAFLNSTKLPSPPDKSTRGYWIKVLREMRHRDELTQDDLRRAVRKMRDTGGIIKSPESVRTVALDIRAANGPVNYAERY